MNTSLAALRNAYELANRDPMLFAKTYPGRPVTAPRPRTAKDYTREVDLAIIEAAGTLVSDLVPEEHRAAVGLMIANQLHHLASPTYGWPSATLPVPARSEWR